MSKKILLLFDVDGTLTKPIQLIEPSMVKFLQSHIMPKYSIGLVGGSDFKKISYQMGGESVIETFDYVFAENGLVAYKHGKLFAAQDLVKHMGEEKLQSLINFALGYMSKLKLPVKRGTFVEFRSGMINFCPVGRSCSHEERMQFVEYDKEHRVREKFIDELREQFSDINLTVSIGGQISVDCFPTGWDKTYCLNLLPPDVYDQIHFFGDKTSPGGNDHEIFKHARTIGHTVTSPEDTKLQLEELLNQA